MICAWDALLSILPKKLRSEMDKYKTDFPQELRLRLGKEGQLRTAMGYIRLAEPLCEEDLRFVMNAASQYSPWAAATIAKGFLTAPGGHRIGICGEAVMDGGSVKGLRTVTSLNIRIARDFPDIAKSIDFSGNLLILGPPGSGKTTLMRDLIRQLARRHTVGVVDERKELFPVGFDAGLHSDILTNCTKSVGIEMLLRTMGPEFIAVDEITAQDDCTALEKAAWCGVGLLATAHAKCKEDLQSSPVYRPLWQTGLFHSFLVLHRDKSWQLIKEVS